MRKCEKNEIKTEKQNGGQKAKNKEKILQKRNEKGLFSCSQELEGTFAKFSKSLLRLQDDLDYILRQSTAAFSKENVRYPKKSERHDYMQNGIFGVIKKGGFAQSFDECFKRGSQLPEPSSELEFKSYENLAKSLNVEKLPVNLVPAAGYWRNPITHLSNHDKLDIPTDSAKKTLRLSKFNARSHR